MSRTEPLTLETRRLLKHRIDQLIFYQIDESKYQETMESILGKGDWTLDYDEHFTKQFDFKQIEKAVGAVEQMIAEFQSSRVYQECFEAWGRKDNRALRELLPLVFRDITETGADIFYHGVDPKPEGVDHAQWSYLCGDNYHMPIYPKDYVDRIQRIMENGITPSERFADFSSDENIRAVFVGDALDIAYGLIRFEIKTEDTGNIPVYYADGSDFSYMVYTPVLKCPMKVLLVDEQEERDFIEGEILRSRMGLEHMKQKKDGHWHKMHSWDRQFYEEMPDKIRQEGNARIFYLRLVKQELLERGIEFEEKGIEARVW